MFSRYGTEGVFLQKNKKFEADEHLIVYTKDFGKLGITAKSIRKIKSKLRSSSELFCYSNIEFIRGRHYNILTDSELINSFSLIKKDLAKLSVGAKMADLIDSFLPEEEQDLFLWNLIEESFFLLNQLEIDSSAISKNKKLSSFYYYFSFRFLEILGYKPEIGNCIIDKQEEVNIFSPREGGLICEICSNKLRDPLEIKITVNDKLFLKAIFQEKFDSFLGKNLDFDNLEEILKNYIILLPTKHKTD